MKRDRSSSRSILPHVIFEPLPGNFCRIDRARYVTLGLFKRKAMPTEVGLERLGHVVNNGPRPWRCLFSLL